MSLDEKVVDLLEEIRSETAGTQLAVDMGVDDTGRKLDAIGERIVAEIRETRFATLDVMTGSPTNHHWTLDYIENTLLPRWRGEQAAPAETLAEQRRRLIDDEAAAELMGTAK